MRRQRQVELCEFEASLVYRASPRTARAISEKKKKPTIKKNTNNITTWWCMLLISALRRQRQAGLVYKLSPSTGWYLW